MAACVITTGVDAPDCGSRFSSPGINRTDIWIFNHSEVLAFTSSIVGEVDDLTMVATKVGFKLDVHKNTVFWGEELQTSEEAAPFYNQTFTARIIATDTATRNAIEDLVDVDLVIVAKQKNGKFIIVGEDAGVKLTEQTFESGKIAGDAVGNMLVFTGQSNQKTRYFFDTSEAATEVALDALL